jgi:hypothetical protein
MNIYRCKNTTIHISIPIVLIAKNFSEYNPDDDRNSGKNRLLLKSVLLENGIFGTKNVTQKYEDIRLR